MAMYAEQAIFTSLNRGGRSGYHLVARSAGITEQEANELSTWSPSHGGLLTDAMNTTSVNFCILTGRRYALSRTCEGQPEYSGRGGRQLYTHYLIFDLETLKNVHYRIFSLYWDAAALGYLRYNPSPPSQLPTVPFSRLHKHLPPEDYETRAHDLGIASFRSYYYSLAAGNKIQVPYAGDRILLAECLLGMLDARAIVNMSFTTSLKPSNVRPVLLAMVSP